MNTGDIQNRRNVNVKLPMDIAAIPKGNRSWGENYIALCDRDFTDLQYANMIQNMIMDREVYDLKSLLEPDERLST